MKSIRIDDGRNNKTADMPLAVEWRDCMMKRSVVIATGIALVSLIPIAIWLDDILALSIAGLIPLCYSWKHGDLD